MNASWSFHNPVAIHFGAGSINDLCARLPGQRLLLVTTPGMTNRGMTERIKALAGGRIVEVFDGVFPNPTMATLDEISVRYRTGGVDGVVAFGGGSVVDTGKILGVMLGCPDSFSLHAHFLNKMPIPEVPGLPVTAIPTTSGTGSEVTPFATVWDSESINKYSLTHARMFPLHAIVDPQLTYELPWDVTRATGLDALCQALESTWNRNANPLSLNYARHAAKLAWDALAHGKDLMGSVEDRANLMEASLLAGLAISHTRTALCHSISYPVTARFGLAHGLACAITMPAVLRFNAASDDGRLSQLAKCLGYNTATDLAVGIDALLEALQLPRLLKECGISGALLRELQTRMVTVGRADNNLRKLADGDLEMILSEIVFVS